MRRGKVGGFRDYFTDAEVRQIEDYVRDRLDPAVGYGGSPSVELAVAVED